MPWVVGSEPREPKNVPVRRAVTGVRVGDYSAQPLASHLPIAVLRGLV